MIKFNNTEKTLNIELDKENLSEKQIRLIKRAVNLLSHTISTKNESEYFEGSSDLLKLMAAAIKESNFPNLENINKQIPYKQQVLEYSMDELNDFLLEENLLYDN